MKKLLAMLLALVTLLSMAVVVNAVEVTVKEYDFESDSQLGNWEHHWGSDKLFITRGRLHTEKTDQNIMFTTFTKLNETLSAGVTYTVSADILLCRNTYYNGTETVDIPTDVALTFRMNLRTDLDGDDVEVAGSSVNIKCGETKAVTFNYTPATDKTGLLL